MSIFHFSTSLLLVLCFTFNVHAVQVNDTAPDFTLLDAEGNTITLYQQKNQVTFVAFWANWCGPCRQQLRLLTELDAMAGVGVILIDLTAKKNSRHRKQRLDEAGVKFLVLDDDFEGYVKNFNKKGIPLSVILDDKKTVKEAIPLKIIRR